MYSEDFEFEVTFDNHNDDDLSIGTGGGRNRRGHRRGNTDTAASSFSRHRSVSTYDASSPSAVLRPEPIVRRVVTHQGFELPYDDYGRSFSSQTHQRSSRHMSMTGNQHHHNRNLRQYHLEEEDDYDQYEDQQKELEGADFFEIVLGEEPSTSQRGREDDKAVKNRKGANRFLQFKFSRKAMLASLLVFLVVFVAILGTVIGVTRKNMRSIAMGQQCVERTVDEVKGSYIVFEMNGLTEEIDTSERQYISEALVDAYNNVTAGCDDKYQRWMVSSKFVDQLVPVNLDYSIIELDANISCRDCPDEEIFASDYSSVEDEEDGTLGGATTRRNRRNRKLVIRNDLVRHRQGVFSSSRSKVKGRSSVAMRNQLYHAGPRELQDDEKDDGLLNAYDIILQMEDILLDQQEQGLIPDTFTGIAEVTIQARDGGSAAKTVKNPKASKADSACFDGKGKGGDSKSKNSSSKSSTSSTTGASKKKNKLGGDPEFRKSKKGGTLAPTTSEEPSSSSAPSCSLQPSSSQVPTTDDTTPPSKSLEPSLGPTLSKIPSFSIEPSLVPSGRPSISNSPTISDMPTTERMPTISSVPSISLVPSKSPSESTMPSKQPTPMPTSSPTSAPTASPTPVPTNNPTSPPTQNPTRPVSFVNKFSDRELVYVRITCCLC